MTEDPLSDRARCLRQKPTGFNRREIRSVENRHPVVEHVADIDVTAIDHDLDAVGPAALVAVRHVPDSAADAGWRNGRPRSP